MRTASFRYEFRQALNAPAAAAFAWCTDFGPSDGSLFSEKTRRSVRRITDDALILSDITYPEGRRRRIRRLVRIFPEQLAWTNTHLDGPFRHSQFWYRIVADGPHRCRLEFRGLRVESVQRAPSASSRRRHAEELRTTDSTEWRRFLGPALEHDLLRK